MGETMIFFYARKSSCYYTLRVILFFIFLSAFLRNAIGQVNSIKGIVQNERGKSLPFSTIKMYKDSILIGSYVCDSTGRYSLPWRLNNEKNKVYSIQAFFLDLKSERTPVLDKDDDQFITLIISNTIHVLSEVTVKSNSPVIVKKADRLIFVPGKLLSESANGTDILKQTPMVLFNENTEGLSIVGKSGTIIYINNKKSQVPKDMLMQMLRSMHAGNIKSIEIITLPGSEFSANTNGGIININLKRESYEGWQGNVAVQTQQSRYNTTLLNGGLNYRKGKLGVQLIPFLNNSFNYKTSSQQIDYVNGNENILNKDFFRRYLVAGGGLNMDYDISTRKSLSLNTWLSNVHGSSATLVNTRYSAPSQTSIQEYSPFTGKDNYTYKYASLNYRNLLNSLGSTYFDVNLDYNYFFQRQDNTGYIQGLDSIGKPTGPFYGYANILPQEFENISAKIDYVKPLNKTSSLKIGAQVSTTMVDNNLAYFDQAMNSYVINNSLSKDYRYNERYAGLYFNYNAKISRIVNMAAGLRYEQTYYKTREISTSLVSDSVYKNLFPSISLSYVPSVNNQFGINISRRITRPNIELLFPGRAYTNSLIFTENNPFLQPSLTYNLELSYLLKEKYNFFLTYSYTENGFAGFLVPVFESTIKYKSTYLNYGNSYGLNLVVNLNGTLIKNVWDINFTPSLNYTAYSYKQGLTLNTVPYNLSAAFFIDNSIYLSKIYKWSLYTSFQYAGRKHDVSARTENAVSSFDIQVRKSFANISLALFITDIFNSGSVMHNSITPNTLIRNNETITNSYKRSVSLRVRYQFGNSKLKTTRNRGSANDEIKRRSNK